MLLKIILAILLLVCLLDMPYGYYQFVRFLSAAGFSFLAYKAYDSRNQTDMIVYIVLAILFQPLIKIALGRQIWNIVDVIVAVGLVASIFVNLNPQKKYNEK